MKNFRVRALSMILVIIMLMSLLPLSLYTAFAEGLSALNNDEKSTIVIAGSDFQNTDSDHDAGADYVKTLLSQIQAGGYTAADGFLFAGDYDYGYDDSDVGKEKLQAAVQAVYGTEMNEVYVQGNHDDDSLVGSTLSSSGAHDADAYGVYVINEKDYMWYNNDETTIKNTASALDVYMDAKVEDGYTKPIFVVSHLPLHYNMRTYNDGDGMYANYIFDVLNEAGDAGLNIIFLFGHNHSNGWDDYLGGASIYLAKGDSINIAQSSKTSWETETLNFTYMNAGYVAYYRNVNTGSETDLTMTVFEITGDDVTVKRYSESGLHDLKSKGVTNSYKSESGYDPNTTVYESPQTIVLNKSLANVEQKDEGTGITVAAPGITGVTVSVNNVSNFDTTKYSAYASYDIDVAGYTEGTNATVSMPLPNGFDASRQVLVLYNGIVIAKVPVVNGKITFTTNHFSTYDIAQLADGEVDIWVEIPGESKTIFRLVNILTVGKKYVIVSTNQAGSANAVNLNNSNINTASVIVIADANGNYIEAPATTAQWTYSSQKFQNVSTNGRYLRGNNNSLGTTSNSDNSYTSWTYNATYGLQTSNTSWQGTTRYMNSVTTTTSTNSSNTNRVYIYEEETLTTVGEFVGMAGQTNYYLATGAYSDQAAVIAMIKNNITVYTATDDSGSDATETTDYTITGTVNPGTEGTYTLTVTYGGKTLGTISVNVTDKTATSLVVEPMTGSVERGSKSDALTGSTMTVTYDDGTTETVLVTVGMLSGNLNITKNGTYTDLTISYAGKTVEDYTLNVVNVTGTDFPTYPSGGSVDVNKTATGQDFQNTGVSRVELSVSGLPSQKGVDVIVMVDTSSSMESNTVTVNGVSMTRLEVMKQSLGNLITQFNTPVNGQVPDIRVAVADFNNYYSNSSSPYYLDENDHLTDSTIRTGTNNPGDQVYTGSQALNANAFVDAETLNANSFSGIEADSGTNYDYAFDAIYQLGTAIKEQNAENGEERELFVIFMSDGAPYQYNYFSSQSAPGELWNGWLTGTYANADAVPTDSTHDYYYNGLGNPHRMAEAIKGDPNQRYTVIRKNTTGLEDVMESAGQTNMYTVPGLGATMYSIGFCLATDKDVTKETQDTVIKNLSSGEGFYYYADSADDLNNAFDAISGDIRYAAQNAYFVDQMGNGFDLQMNPTIPKSDGSTTTDISTDITVKTFPIYTKEQVGTTVNGHYVTADDVGKAYGTGTILETVKFTSNTVATSTALPNETNIIKDGVICASTFFYNTTTSAKTITLADGSTYSLPGETFYWNIGTINEKQFVLSYAVVLTGALDGDVKEDSYDTNNYATIYYTNWLGNDVSVSVASPTMAWGGANVSYAFYLVDENGDPLAADGITITNIVNAYKLTQPVLYHTINLNSGETVLSAIAKEVLPDGYELYDKDAVYTVNVASGSGSSNWKIEGNYPASTYVTGYDGAQDYSNATSVNDPSYDYTHTTVYFAVVWTVGTVPDAVVIDFGLPVDISVLGNDMFGQLGQLAAVGPYTTDMEKSHTGSLSSGFGDSYGNAVVQNNGTVRFTPGSMEMGAPVVFAYAVYYRGSTNSGYYYGKITVIPATTIYYEESFVEFNNSNAADADYGAWGVAGEVISGATQDEDRPGEFSLPQIDANNFYGYDSAYANCTQYSLGDAMKVTVNAATGTPATAPTATFTFTGTGFDIISLTNSDSGMIIVSVYQGEEFVKGTRVDNYYGYKYENGKWVVDKESTDTIWQVPVIKMEGLDYGTYTVKIQVAYMPTADHVGDGYYSFWLDAIRIYDPAGPDADPEGAYTDDNELKPDYITLRDLLVDAGSLSGSDSSVNGVVFIDGIDTVGNSQFGMYENPGPNNETYLAQGQAVAFKLVTSAEPASVQIGVKLAYGESATLNINTSTIRTVETATDMYYKLPVTWEKNAAGYYEATVVLSNSNESAGAVISITNLKVTGDANIVSPASTTVVVDDELLMTASYVMRKLYYVPFEPEYVHTKWTTPGRPNSPSLLTVTTSEDVEAITVNGKEISDYTRIPVIKFVNRKLVITYYRVWFYVEKLENAGTYNYDVVLFDEEGRSSDTIETEVTVKGRTR